MDFTLKTLKGKREFKDVHITIRNYYDLKKANKPFENLQKICENEDMLTLAEMLEIILKKYGVEKGEIADAPLKSLNKVVEIMIGLTTEDQDEESSEGNSESSGELI